MRKLRLCGERLDEAAAAQGDHTGYAIAKRTGLAQSTVSRLRRGLARPTAETLAVLGSTYRITMDDLVTADAEVDAGGESS